MSFRLCPFRSGPLGGLDHALAVSCNLAFANLGVRLGAAAMRDEYARWGFDEGAGDHGRVRTTPRTPRQLADLSVGLELVDVTPLHAALLAATIAFDGRSVSPRLVTGPCGPLGLTPPGSPAAPSFVRAASGPGDAGGAMRAERLVLDPALARRLRRAMLEVASSGTAAGLAPPGFPVSMKTGTAAEPGQGYHVNYIGFGPLPEASPSACA